ncbi:MAG: Zn-dependent hydrolase [Bacteroidales bacterium]|nr:Zn-dependent hydrolase [Bacteroidales bacterium]
MNRLYIMAATAIAVAACAQKADDSALKEKVDSYAVVEVKSPLYDALSENDKKIVGLFREAADIIDGMFWKQTFGDKADIENLPDGYAKSYAMINYGAWDHLDDNKPFIEGYGDKPLGCCYYPQDMTMEEWNAFEDPDKLSLYTMIRRDEKGALKTVWYRDEFKAELEKICSLLEEAAALTTNEGMKTYLTERVKAFRTDDYLASDMAWMDMKDCNMDLVIGPIENYDDHLFEAKAAYECFILLKDEKRSANLAKYVGLLPTLQKQLPCKPEYKTFVPGTSSDLNVYDAIYYAGDCNAGSKTIAINLPNDERVHAAKGARRLQLYNSMMAKFDKILMPIGEVLMDPAQLGYLSADAFFWNVTFHEVAHGLGVKQTVNGKGTVDEAMGSEKTTWEEAKADILGLFMVSSLIDMGEITDITKEQSIATFIAGIVRSVRFGSASSHGKANMMCFNYMEDHGAFSRNAEGKYVIDFAKATAAINSWAELILETQATGNFEFAQKYAAENASIRPALAAEVAKVNEAGIPRDIVFDFAW